MSVWFWHVLHAYSTSLGGTGLPARHAGDASPASRAWTRTRWNRHHLCCKASCSVYRLYIHHGGRRGASGHAHSVFVRANSVGPVLLTAVARTGRCHPPLYAADPGRTSYVVHARPPQLTPEVSGSSGPHCVEQVDFWGESLEGRERARQSSILCRCRKSSPPRGTNSIMAMGPAGGQYSPTPLPTGLEEQAPAVCIPPGFFLLGGLFLLGGPIGYSIKPKMTLRVVHKTKNDPSSSP